MGMVSPPNNAVPEAALTQCLRELPNCVILRNEEDLFGNLQRGGDIDLLAEDLELAEQTLIHHLGCPIRITRRSYVIEYFYDWGNVDLLPSIEWRGARLVRTEAIVDGRQISERGRPVPKLAHEALISWLTSVLWGGFFKERYRSVIRQAVEVDGVVFRQALLELAGRKWGARLWQAAAEGHPETSATWAQSLRWSIWWRACFRSPARTIKRYLTFVITELRLRFEPPVPWIVMPGSDEGGKSSLIQEIVHRFAGCPYANVEAVHWRPTGSGLSLLASDAEWLVRYWTGWVHLRAKGYVLAFVGGPRFARALWCLFPKPDLVFLLDSEPDLLWRQKQAPDSRVLNGSLPPSVLGDEIQRVIRAGMLDRTAASLDGVQPPMMAAPGAIAEGSREAPQFIEPR